jgi:hypothetical protein
MIGTDHDEMIVDAKQERSCNRTQQKPATDMIKLFLSVVVGMDFYFYLRFSKC